ncbi:MAG: AIR synthase-related protein [Chloroflexota bacterium]|nr:AIR synthase-related protein [Chloroflexota bacterium]
MNVSDRGTDATENITKVADAETELPPGKLPAALLARLIDTYVTPHKSVLVGPGLGRDAAAIDFNGSTMVVKSDPITFATTHAAQYLVTINANDLACLGARPRWLLVVALLPELGTTPTSVETHFRELSLACDAAGIALIGGHTEITSGLTRPILVGTLMGDIAPGELLVPGGARAGDVIVMTKSIAIEGTALLATDLRDSLTSTFDKHWLNRASDLLLDPGISVVADARLLLQFGEVTALHDPTEGGLATGIHELANAAGLGAELDTDVVPVLTQTQELAGQLGLNPLGMLASGTLLATIPENRLKSVSSSLAGNLRFTLIGRMLPPQSGFWQIRGGMRAPLPYFARDEVARALAMQSDQ